MLVAVDKSIFSFDNFFDSLLMILLAVAKVLFKIDENWNTQIFCLTKQFIVSNLTDKQLFFHKFIYTALQTNSVTKMDLSEDMVAPVDGPVSATPQITMTVGKRLSYPNLSIGSPLQSQ